MRHPGEGLLRDVGELALAAPGLAGGGGDLAGGEPGEEPEDEDGHEHDEGQDRVEPGHDAEHRDEGEDVDDERHTRADGDLLQPPHVGDEPLDDVAGAGAAVVAAGQALHVVEDPGAQPRRHPAATEGEGDGGAVVAHRPQPDDGDRRQAAGEEQLQAGLRPGVGEVGPEAAGERVDGQLGRPGLEHPEEHLGEQQHAAAGEQGALAVQVR